MHDPFTIKVSDLLVEHGFHVELIGGPVHLVGDITVLAKTRAFGDLYDLADLGESKTSTIYLLSAEDRVELYGLDSPKRYLIRYGTII